LMIIAIAEQPCFTDGAVARKRRGEQIGQAPSSP
jgi:hypothetical protein